MKFLNIFAIFLFVINSFSQVKKSDSIIYVNFLNEKNYENKKNIFKNILKGNSTIKSTEEWIKFFNNEERKNKSDFLALYNITLCKVFLYNSERSLEKSNEILYNFYYKFKNNPEKEKLCRLLNLLFRNCEKLNKTSELLIINKEKLETCSPNTIVFYDVYSKLGLLDLAIKNFKVSKSYKEDEISFENGTNQNNLGVFYKREKEYDSAFYYFDKSLNILEKVKKTDVVKDNKNLNYWIGLVKGNLGECFLEFKNYNKALELLTEEELQSRLFYKGTIWPYEDDYYKNMAICYLKTDKLSLAKKYTDSLFLKKNILSYSKLKSAYFEIIKRYDSAFYYNKLYIEASYLTEKQNKQELNTSILKLLDFQEELISQKFKITEIENENKSNKKEFLIIFSILVVLVVFIILLINLIYKKNIGKKIIENQNEAINNSLLEKNVLLGELHHRVKNNFQIIISILNLQLQKINNEEFKNTFQYSINRVTTIARIHDKLLKNNNLNEIPLKDYIENILTDLKVIYNSLHTINININVDRKIFIYIDQTQALGLIINELITNSYKYAFSNNNNNNLINLTISEKEGIIYFEYSDNGIGFDLNNIMIENSIGLKLIQRLANQLGTKADITSREGMETTFSFKNKLDL
ncbi:histidine kinase dimerization/phosphoacceptor domain -containing protein [Polaribacter glomeratus]|uniref:histidine kinase n=1 Tax=Polaribacter glomeratus TaxID=102 RepID=A0A2S7WVU3_9FLAO|nr:histidine kinase dimerization/phosphoacceptor domain -containing protein [Polaribacter glomeratus]PQJ81606.1 hypothetical protein BTO16_03060 [Polaribacter glomeratus]TXD66469.1 hypothetical protein ESX12_06715 [Polaribacter glomeratus]